MKLTIQQNLNGGASSEIYYSAPTVLEWRYANVNPNYAAISGHIYNIPKQLKVARKWPAGATNDSGEGNAFPFYNYLDGTTENQAPSPIASVVTKNQITDAPGSMGGYPAGMVDGNGKIVGIFRFDKITRGVINFTYQDWAVIAKYSDTGVLVNTETFAKTGWTVNVDTSGANQEVAGGTSTPTTARGVDLPISIGSEEKSESPITGAGTQPFTAP
jgi:hypothetical protein